ncbi:FUSC family protein [Candidatus Binatia bacterium]|nr:FUSC family protein [Candidatus Binatia bacterium]
MSDPRTPCKRTTGPTSASHPLDPDTPTGATIRTTVAAVAAMALAFALHLEVPALAVVFVLARGSAGALTMLGGALAGSALGLVLLALFDQSRVAFSALLLALTTIGTYGALGRRFAYGWVQALLSLLVLVGQSLDVPDTAVQHAFYDLADVLVAALCAFVAGAAPPSALPARLQDALASRLRGLGRLAEHAGAAPNTTVLAGAAPDTAVLALERSAARTRTLLAGSWPTRLASRARFRALAVANDLVDRIQHQVLVQLAVARLVRSRPSAHVVGSVALTLEPLAALVEARRGPLDDDRATRVMGARSTARALHRASRADETIPGAAGRRVRLLAARLALLSPFLAADTRSVPRLATRRAPWRLRPAFDRYRLRHAVKSAVSYLLVLWAWIAADWGAIVPALVVAVLVATLATPVGATLRKALLRVAGVLVGGLAGLLVAVVLLPFVTELPAICLVAGIFVFGFLWVQQHHERLSFAALQAAIAFILTLVHGTAPSPTWHEPLESLIGLAFGIVVVVGIMHAAWPIDATTSAHAALAELLELAGRRLERLLGDATHRSVASRRDDDSARAAREHAVGSLHEVELYGTQFGRPMEDLARLARPILELDALVSVLESARERTMHRHDPTAASRRAYAAALCTDCRLVAAELRALPGERLPSEECERALTSARYMLGRAPLGGFQIDPAGDVATTLIDALLRDVVRALDDGPAPARRAA